MQDVKFDWEDNSNILNLTFESHEKLISFVESVKALAPDFGAEIVTEE